MQHVSKHDFAAVTKVAESIGSPIPIIILSTIKICSLHKSFTLLNPLSNPVSCSHHQSRRVLRLSHPNYHPLNTQFLHVVDYSHSGSSKPVSKPFSAQPSPRSPSQLASPSTSPSSTSTWATATWATMASTATSRPTSSRACSARPSPTPTWRPSSSST